MRAAFIVQEPRSSALRALNYSPRVEAFRRPRRGLRTVRLGSLLKALGDAYGTVFTRRDCSEASGIELLSQVDVFTAEPHGRIIRRDSMPNPDLHQIKRWQVLVSGAGQMGEATLFGRSVLADERLQGKYIGPDSVVLTFEDEGGIDNLYAYAFLLTSAGLEAVRSTAYGTSIPRVRVDLLADLPVPVASDAVKERVATLIRTAVQQLERYLTELRAARRPIDELPEAVDALASCNERRSRCIGWDGPLPTLTAWNFASTGDALPLLRKKWKARLGDVVAPDGIYNGPRFARIPCEAPNGVILLSQRDAFLSRFVARRVVPPPVAARQLFVPEGSLILGGHGTLGEGEIFGRTLYVDRHTASHAFSQDFLRVHPIDGRNSICYAVLSSAIGFRLVRSAAVGTKIMTLRPDLLRALPFPEVDAPTANRIERHLFAAASARVAAHEAEAEATRIVEDEVIAPWRA